jgi:4'-phosphopantetheinyl transferase
MNASTSMTRPSLIAPPRRRLAPAGLKLPTGEIDIWRASLDEQSPEAVQQLQTLVSADEAERARRFYFERDRRRFIVGRGILRMILGHYVGLAPKTLVFRYGPNGKPALAPTQAGARPIYFNVAHSEGLVLLAFTRVGEVGIDLERIRHLPEWEQIAASSFSPREIARIYAAPAEQRVAEFFRAWTRQEAVLKALGVGLNGVGAKPRRPDLAEGAPENWTPEPGENGQGAENGFAVHPLHPAPDFAAALATNHAGRWTTCLTWPAREPLARLPLRRQGRRIRLEKLPHHEAAFL